MRNSVLAGYRLTDGSLRIRGYYAFLWSSSVAEASAWRRSLSSSLTTEHRTTNDKSYGFSAIYKIKGGQA